MSIPFIQKLFENIELSNIKEIVFDRCQIDSAIGSTLVPFIAKATSLSILRLPGNQLGKSLQHILKALQGKPVTHLDFSGNIIDVNSFKLDPSFFNLPLKYLNFSNTKIHNFIALEELAKIVEIETLESLNLSCSIALMTSE